MNVGRVVITVLRDESVLGAPEKVIASILTTTMEVLLEAGAVVDMRWELEADTEEAAQEEWDQVQRRLRPE